MTNKKTYLTKLPKQEFLEAVWTHVSSGNYAICQKNAEEKYQIIFNGTSQKFYEEIRDLKFSEDGKQYAYVAKNEQGYVLIKNGKEHASYEFIGYNSIRWSPRNLLAYTIHKKGEGYFVVYDEQEYGPFEEQQPNEGYNVPLFAFDPITGKMAYAAKRNGKWAVEVSGKRCRQYDLVMDIGFTFQGYLYFRFRKKDAWGVSFKGKEVSNGYDLITDITTSKDGNTIAFFGKKENSWQAILNAECVGIYDRISTPKLSDEGTVFAFQAEMKDDSEEMEARGDYFVVINGNHQTRYENILGLAISPDAKTVAYVGVNDNYDRFIVINEKELKSYKDIYHHSLRFSPDSIHLGYLAFDKSIFNGKKQSIIVIDENESEPYDAVYSTIEFSEDSTQVSYMAVQNNALYLIEHQL